MAALDRNALNDFVYDLLNVAGVTSLATGGIFHKRVGPGEEPSYPMVTYQVWNRFRPDHTLASGVSSYMGSYRIVGWTRDDQRAAYTIQKAIEAAVLLSSYSLVGGAQIVNVMVDEYVDDTDDQRGDGHVYHQAGAIFQLEVTA